MEVNKRGKKPSEESRLVVPLSSQSMEPEDYADKGTSVIKYGLLMALKMRDGKATIEDLAMELTMAQAQYLNMRANGVMSRDACKALGIEQTMPLLWQAESEQDSVFMQCIDGLKKLEADTVEEIVWQRAMGMGGAVAERQMAIKARKPEYRDNFQTQVNMITQVRITRNGEEFDTSANYKRLPGEEE